MDLSIKDLIVQTERPGSGLRGRAAQTALAGASQLSMAAFNDLMGKFNVEDRNADAGERPSAPTRATRPASRDSRAASDNRDTTPRKTTRKDESAAEDGSADTAKVSTSEDRTSSETTPAPDSTTVAVLPEMTVAPSAAPQTAMAPTTGKTTTGDTPAQAGGDIVAGKATADDALAQVKAQSGTISDGKNDAGPANGAKPSQATPGSSARPATLADFSALAVDAAGEPDALTNAEIAGLVKNTAKGTSAANQNNAPVADSDGPTDSAFMSSRAAVAATTEPRPTPAIRDDVMTSAAASRAEANRGLLAAQEVTGDDSAARFTVPNGNTSSAASGAQNTTGQSPAQNTAAGTTTGAVSPPALGVAAANVESGPSTFRPLVTNSIQVVNGPSALQGAPTGPNALHASTTNPARAATTVSVPLDDVAVNIARAAATGSDHITIKLKPAALGHVDVKLDVTDDGRVTAVISADRPDTLDMLARDAKSLERALADAGLKADSGSLQFNLRHEGGNAFGRDASPEHTDLAPQDGREASASESPIPASIASGYVNTRAGVGGVDIRV